MPFQYKKVLIIGATSGIGKALASRLVQEGSFVIVVGRRKENIEAFVHEHGKDKATGVPFDVTELDKIHDFAADITKAHPDLDCVFLNSGIQRGYDFSKPETVNMAVVHTEITTNYLSNLSMTNAFLPFLKSKKEETALIYTTSGLALVPILRCANYCASKAAMHHYLLCLREQLKEKGSPIKIVELFPPMVQTELHDAKHQPDIKNGREMGVPLAQFIDEAYAGLAAGQLEVKVGSSIKWYNLVEPARQKLFHYLVDSMKEIYG